MFELNGKVALVTGSGRGIGKAIALALAKQGAKVVVSSTSATCEKVAEEIKANGGESIAVKCDVGNKADLENLAAKAVEAYGPIDILVNNAGITRDARFIKMSEDDWDAVLDTNLKSVFMLSQIVAPSMIERKSGRIINISSASGIKGNFGQCNYTAAKGGMIAMTKTFAIELGKYGITANCVAPGAVETDMLAAVPDNVREQMKAKLPLQRLGKPEDIAAAVAFLASDESSFITGLTLNVNGGLL